jgi:hypothetical protein
VVVFDNKSDYLGDRLFVAPTYGDGSASNGGSGSSPRTGGGGPAPQLPDGGSSSGAGGGGARNTNTNPASPVPCTGPSCGGGGGGGGGTGGTGSCTTGDCATESTQLANKGLLSQILDYLKGVANVGDPQSRSGSEVGNGMGLSGFDGLAGWRVPPHAANALLLRLTGRRVVKLR